MKIKFMLISILLASTGVNAASCLNEYEKRVVDRNHANSADEFYGSNHINCQLSQLKKFCSDPYNVKMMNTLLRLEIWNIENATKTQYTKKQLNGVNQGYTKHAVQSTCKSVRKEFFDAIASNAGWDYD